MKKTILLGEKGMISTKISKWLFTILGLLWLLLGIIRFYEDGAGTGSIAYLVIAFAFILYSILVFTVNPFAPKVILSDEEIVLKRKAFSSPVKILWNSIQSIEFNQYMIAFHSTEGVEEFSYSTNADISIEIKTAIREIAEQKNIQVVGG